MSHRAHQVVIIGSGFAGLGMAIKLKERGENDFVILEQRSGLGGTWRLNTYPGCACDVMSHLYSFSFAPNPDWSRLYSPQSEILEYLERTAEQHGLGPHLRFNAEVTRCEFDQARAVWVVTLAGGERVEGRVLVAGMGGLSRPSIPRLPGLETFEGRVFHSAQWDHGYPLEGKKVAVIGTGASAIQFVPQLQKQVARLDLYQRTPPWIVAKADRPLRRWERWLLRKVPLLQGLVRALLYVLYEWRAVGFVVNPKLLRLGERMAKKHLNAQVEDPVLREKLTPSFPFGCKRVLISDDYYPAVAQPNVQLVTDGIAEITPRGVRTTDGIERAVDAIILGTGFRATDLLTPLQVIGLGGVDLNERWKSGIEAHLGTTISGFPNLFMMTGPNTGLGHNSMVYMIESQIQYVLSALETMRRQKLSWVDVKKEVQSRFNLGLQNGLKKTVWSGGCTSWYLDANGKNVTLWPGFTFQYRRLTRRFEVAQYNVVGDERHEDRRTGGGGDRSGLGHRPGVGAVAGEEGLQARAL